MGKEGAAAVDRLAEDQYGAVAWRQAIALGMSDKAIRCRLRSGRWRVAQRGVYVVAGSPDSFERRVMVAILGESEDAAASHMVAGYLLGLLITEPRRIDVTVLHGSWDGRRGSGTVVHVAYALGSADVRTVRRIRVTCPERTVVDLARVLDRGPLEGALDRALIMGLTTLAVLERYINARNLGRLKGGALLRRLIEDRKEHGPHRSGLERAMRRVLRARRFPRYVRQFKVGAHEVDLVFPEFMVAVEIDHVFTHGSAASLRSDDERQNAIVLAGYLLLRFTEERIYGEPESVAAEIANALMARGWLPL
ncbi:MAG: type IV toxin-antitoxin system AbiEi family antitoxin domain-containing protein [Actinomycetota bacterium]